jgi:hypothetical protein
MGDVWAVFSELDGVTQERLAGVLETRGADAQQQAMRHAFLGEIDFPSDARVLEVWLRNRCLDAATRRVAGRVRGRRRRPLPIPARQGAPAGRRALPNVSFASGYMAVFDGDYATATVALGDHDPVQACVEAMMAVTVNDRWLVRRLPALARASGFSVVSFRSYGFAEIDGSDYMLSVIDRGADLLRSRGQIGEDFAERLRREARRRVEAGTFFAHIAYASLVAEKPA